MYLLPLKFKELEKSNDNLTIYSFQAALVNLKDVLFVGNPFYDDCADKNEARLRVLAHLPQVTKIDGELVKPSEIEASKEFMDD